MTLLELFADYLKDELQGWRMPPVPTPAPDVQKIELCNFISQGIEKKAVPEQLGTVNKVQCSLHACWC